MKNAIFLLIFIGLVSCADKAQQTDSANAVASNLDVTTSQAFAKKNGDFKSYWFRGLAELNRFEVQQSRYGEMHDSEAVMVFVTEPFLPGPQVKQDYGKDPTALQVLKLNFHRRFYTGIYPYSILTSTFTPATQAGPTIKLSQTVQEWCGHVFAQLNLNDAKDGYRGMGFSYFQSEGDTNFEVKTDLIEDEIYTRIRLGPDKLPTGQIALLPSATYLRLAHKPWAVVTATASISEAANSDFSSAPVRTYSLSYTEPAPRTVKIHFEEAFPHRIVGFEDTYEAIMNPDGGPAQRLTTVGKLTNSIMLDYWAKHGNEHTPWRDALGVTF